MRDCGRSHWSKSVADVAHLAPIEPCSVALKARSNFHVINQTIIAQIKSTIGLAPEWLIGVVVSGAMRAARDSAPPYDTWGTPKGRVVPREGLAGGPTLQTHTFPPPKWARRLVIYRSPSIVHNFQLLLRSLSSSTTNVGSSCAKYTP